LGPKLDGLNIGPVLIRSGLYRGTLLYVIMNRKNITVYSIVTLTFCRLYQKLNIYLIMLRTLYNWFFSTYHIFLLPLKKFSKNYVT